MASHAGWPSPQLTSREVTIPSIRLTILTTVASKFYETVFGWAYKTFPGQTAEHRENMMLYDFRPDFDMGGCIQKAPDETGALKTGAGGPCLFWIVENLEKTAVIIEEAGGKMLSGSISEGENGIYRYFEDTEGTVGGVYQAVGK